MATENLQIGIKKIKDLEFFIDEDIQVNGPFDFNHNVSIVTNAEDETVSFIILVNYFLTQTQTPFMRSKSITVFNVKNLKSVVKVVDGRELFDIPDQLLVTMFSISFTHSRALHAKSCAGTKYSELLMPLINPDHEFRKLFGPNLENLSQPPVPPIEKGK